MMDDLVERAKFEAALLARATPELQALAAPTVAELTPAEDGATARVSGKGAKSKPAAAKKKKSKGRGGAKPPSLKALSALALSQEGVVRLDGVLQASTAASLRAEILERRAAAFAAVEGGEDWRLYFADVLLKADRCDLLMPLKGNRGMQMALRELLVGSRAAGDGGGGGGGGGGASTTLLHGVLGSTLGEDATLYAMWRRRWLGHRPTGAREGSLSAARSCSRLPRASASLGDLGRAGRLYWRCFPHSKPPSAGDRAPAAAAARGRVGVRLRPDRLVARL